jgi:hypothetical protein
MFVQAVVRVHIIVCHSPQREVKVAQVFLLQRIHNEIQTVII